MMTNSLFSNKLTKILKEYKLAGGDFGPEKGDHHSVRKALKMQPSTYNKNSMEVGAAETTSDEDEDDIDDEDE